MPIYVFGPDLKTEVETLQGLGFTGSLNDMQFAYLRANGYAGALNDMLFGGTGAVPTPPLSPLTGNLLEGSAAGTIIATGFNYTPSAISNVSPANWIALSGGNLVAGSSLSDYESFTQATCDLTYDRGQGDEVLTFTVFITNKNAPAAPSAPTVLGTSATAILVTLTSDPSSDAPVTSRDIRYSTDNVNWTNITGVTSPRSITGLASSTTYFVQWRAVSSEGNGSWSTSGSGATQSASGGSTVAPEAMDAPGMWPASTTAIDVVLPAPPVHNAPIDSYSLEWSYNSDFSGSTTITGITSLTTQITGLTAASAGTKVYARVYAVSGSLTSPAGRTKSHYTHPTNQVTIADAAALATAHASLTSAGGVVYLLADGDYTGFTRSTKYTNPVFYRSQTIPTYVDFTDRTGGAVFLATGGTDAFTITGAGNIYFENVKFYCPQVDPAVQQRDLAGIKLSGSWDRIGARKCEFAGSTIEKTARGFNWSRPWQQSDSNLGKNLDLWQNWTHDADRGMILALSITTTDNENFVYGNVGTDCYQFAFMRSGGSNLTTCWNYFSNFFSVDVAFDTSIEGALAAASGTSITLPNVAAVTAVPLDGYRYMSIEAFTGPNTGETRTITAYDNTTRVLTLGSAFTNTPALTDQYKIRDPSQAHQSAYPMTPKSGNQWNIKDFGNIYAGTAYRAQFCQIAGMKLDDKNNSTDYYKSCWIAGNLMVASQSISLEISNGDENSGIVYNTLVWDENWLRRNSPATRVSGGGTSYMTVENNVSAGLSPQGTDVGAGAQGGVGTYYHADRNIRAGRADTTPSPTLAAMFDGPSFTAVHTDPLTVFNAKAGGPCFTASLGSLGAGATAGAVTWPASFNLDPRAGSLAFTLPRRNSTVDFTDVLNAALGSIEATAPVQVNDISEECGVWFGTNNSGGTAQVQVLDTNGTSVLTAWTTPTWSTGKSSVSISPGQHLQVRMTSASALSTTRDVEVRIGTSSRTYSVTTSAVGDSIAPILSAVSATANTPTTANATVTTDDTSGTLSWVVTTSSTRPTDAQIVAGQDHTGAAQSAGKFGSFTPGTVGANAFSISGLTGSTAYWIHCSQIDASGNRSTGASSASSFTTPASGSGIFYLGEIQADPSGLASQTYSLSSLGLAADDIVVVVYGVGSNSDRTIGVQTAGYTELAEPFANDTNDANLSVSWKRMGVSPDTDVTVEFTSGGYTTSAGNVHIRAYRGVDTVTAIDATASPTAPINTKLVNPPSITPVTTNALIVCTGVGAGPAAHTNVYSSSDLEDFTSHITSLGSFSAVVGVGHQVWTSGAFDAAAWTGADDDTTCSYACIVFALKPA